MKENTTSNEECILLLTGTIQPNTQQTVKLIDSNERRKQYIDAIDFYLKKTNFKLLFVENSGNDISKHFKDYQKRTEFLTYVSKPTIPDRGKGYKEMEILEYAYKNSNILSKSEYIIKITGRLKILNINSLFKSSLINRDRFVLCNIYKLGKMDSRCFLFHKNFWSSFKIYKTKIDKNYSLEMALWYSIKDYCNSNNDSKLYRQFDRALLINGYSGGFGTTYHRGFIVETLKQIKHLIYYKKNKKVFADEYK